MCVLVCWCVVCCVSVSVCNLSHQINLHSPFYPPYAFPCMSAKFFAFFPPWLNEPFQNAKSVCLAKYVSTMTGVRKKDWMCKVGYSLCLITSSVHLLDFPVLSYEHSTLIETKVTCQLSITVIKHLRKSTQRNEGLSWLMISGAHVFQYTTFCIHCCTACWVQGIELRMP